MTFLEGQLYESTGDPNQDGSSLVAQMNLTTGQPINDGTKPAKVGLDASKFGEGITILNGGIILFTSLPFCNFLLDFIEIIELNLISSFFNELLGVYKSHRAFYRLIGC